jgi:hypothetical protein
MDFTFNMSLLAIGLFFAMLVLLEIGRRIGSRRMAIDPEGVRAGVGAVEGAVFALLGLLIAFTFSSAASRFDARRQLIVDEANAIGTAYLRLDLLNGQSKEQLRQDFRRYLETRIQAYQKLPDKKAAQQTWDNASSMLRDIWDRAVSVCHGEGSQPATMLVLPALNQMIDITATRAMAKKTHPPAIIFGMLCVLALLSALIAGYGMARGKTRSWMHIIGFAAIMAVTLYVILDLEYPRLGVIRVDSGDEVMLELIQSMR